MYKISIHNFARASQERKKNLVETFFIILGSYTFLPAFWSWQYQPPFAVHGPIVIMYQRGECQTTKDQVIITMQDMVIAIYAT